MGYVADFCPVCRNVTQFLVQEVGLAGHVHNVSIGNGDLQGYQRDCLICSTFYEADYLRYATFSQNILPLEELIRKTFPNLHDALTSWLSLEKTLKHTPSTLSASERQELILEPFLALSPKAEKYLQQANFDIGGTLALAAMVALGLLGKYLGSILEMKEQEAGSFFVMLGLIPVIWQVKQADRRFVKHQIAPMLVKTLLPLKPTEFELQSVIDQLRQGNYKLGAKLKIKDLLPK